MLNALLTGVCGLWGTAFPYYRNGELVNVKYRSLDKEFSQVPKAEKVLFGVDDCKGASEIIIVEGEMDKLALEEAGFRHVVSVPDGAPPRLFTCVFQCFYTLLYCLCLHTCHFPSSLSSCMPCSVGFCAKLGLLCTNTMWSAWLMAPHVGELGSLCVNALAKQSLAVFC